MNIKGEKMQTNILGLRKRMMLGLILCMIAICVLIIRVAYIQLIAPDELRAKAEEQQSSSRSIQSKRGTIYDATGENILAVSSSVETVTVNPVNISNENKEKVARKLSEIFELDYETVLKKVKKIAQ